MEDLKVTYEEHLKVLVDQVMDAAEKHDVPCVIAFQLSPDKIVVSNFLPEDAACGRIMRAMHELTW